MDRLRLILRALLTLVAILMLAVLIFGVALRLTDRIDPVAGKVVWVRDGPISSLGVANALDTDGKPAGPYSTILEHVISATANTEGTITATYRATDGSTATFTCDANGQPLAR